MNTGGQGWGGDWPHRKGGRMELEPGTLQDPQGFCVERSSGQSLVVTVPPQPRTAATVSQQEGPGPIPNTGPGGVSAWLSLPGCFSQRWLRETGTGDGAVPQGAAAVSSFDSSAAAGAPRGSGSGSVAPSRIEGTSTALWGGVVPSPQTLKHSCLSLKTSVKKIEQNKR